MITIPNFDGEVAYKSYSEFRSIAESFDTFEIFGKDESGNYDLFSISLGNPDNPCILMLASMHGSEWHGTDYTLDFMQQIRDDTYPDKELRDRLINDFYLLFIVMQNPWGVDQVPNDEYGEYTSGGASYSNVNGVSFNSDYYTFTQSETQAIRDYTQDIKPFAVLDIHLFQPDYPSAYGRNAIMGNGMQPNEDYRKVTEPYAVEWKKSMENKIGEEITRWTNILSSTSGLARAYFARQSNHYTPYTLSYISEVARPAYKERDGEMVLIRKLSDTEIFDYGLTHIHCFLVTSIQYFDDYEEYRMGDFVTQIVTEHKTIEIERDNDGVAKRLIETYNEENGGYVIETIINRNSKGQVTDIDRKML